MYPLQAMNGSGLHVDLLRQKLVQWLDQVLVKIEVIMRHLKWEHQERLPRALIVQLLSVIIWYQSVFLSMDDESGTSYLRHHFQVIKMLCDQIA